MTFVETIADRELPGADGETLRVNEAVHPNVCLTPVFNVFARETARAAANVGRATRTADTDDRALNAAYAGGFHMSGTACLAHGGAPLSFRTLLSQVESQL